MIYKFYSGELSFIMRHTYWYKTAFAVNLQARVLFVHEIQNTTFSPGKSLGRIQPLNTTHSNNDRTGVSLAEETQDAMSPDSNKL